MEMIYCRVIDVFIIQNFDWLSPSDALKKVLAGKTANILGFVKPVSARDKLVETIEIKEKLKPKPKPKPTKKIFSAPNRSPTNPYLQLRLAFEDKSLLL